MCVRMCVCEDVCVWLTFGVCVCVFDFPGAIELAVYSDHFKTELDVVDIQSQRIDRFGTHTHTLPPPTHPHTLTHTLRREPRLLQPSPADL